MPMTRIVPRVTQSHKRHTTTIVIFLGARTTIARFGRDSHATSLGTGGGSAGPGRAGPGRAGGRL